MGKLDDNDAVQFDDAYSEDERRIINDNIGRQVQERYLRCGGTLPANNINPVFKTYETVGHLDNGRRKPEGDTILPSPDAGNPKAYFTAPLLVARPITHMPVLQRPFENGL